MVTTQSFRLLGKSDIKDIKDITCDQVDGENVVFWEDIEQVFPGVKYITNSNTVINMMRDSNRKRIIPQCIKHYPGVVLDVVLSTAASDGLLEPSTGDSSVTLTEELSSTPAMTLDYDQEVVQRLASSLTPNIQARLRSASNGYDLVDQAIKEGQMDPSDVLKRCVLELKTEMARNMQLSTRVAELIEKKGQQEQTSNQLDQLQKRVQSVLTRNYELHEEPDPRLFVVLPLPHRPSSDPQGSFSNTFRLYFLCDCGKHTMSAGSKTSHHIHFAKHEGYDIVHPDEFFKNYGSYVLAILKMLKFGISVAGTTVPSISNLVNASDNDQLTPDQQLLTCTIESGMNLIMEYIEKVLKCEGETTADIVDNAVPLAIEDLRQLAGFLRKKDDSDVLANLYRTVTTEGHVHWVCIDHYRERHQENRAKALRDTLDDVDGFTSFNESAGRLTVELYSRRDADMLYLALEKANGVCALRIVFCWNQTYHDFKRLRDTLAKTNVGILELDLQCHEGPESDSLYFKTRYNPIFDIMRHSTIQSVTLSLTPVDFIIQSSLLSSNDVFHSLRRLSIELTSEDLDIPSYKSLLAKAPNLSHLVVFCGLACFLQLYSAIAEQQTYTITLSYESLRILPLSTPLQSTTPLKDLEHLLEVHGERIELITLDENDLHGPTAATFAKATEMASRLKELNLNRANGRLSVECIDDLTRIVARSKLRKLDINLEAEEERLRILDSVRWEYIRHLKVIVDGRSLGMGPLKALVDGIEPLLGKAQVEHFAYWHEYEYEEEEEEKEKEKENDNLSIAEERLLQSFLALTSLKRLELNVKMTSKQLQSLIDSANVSRLQTLVVLAKGFTPDDVDAILERLQHAVGLQVVRLSYSDTTEEQITRMKGKGIQLSRY